MEAYEDIKERQQLNVAFDGYIGLLIRMFNNVNKEPHVYATLTPATSPYCSYTRMVRVA
jgi:hypothetical protein